ncbi:MAG TPA: hypothetical protein VGE36_04515 [Roseateles sp.]
MADIPVKCCRCRFEHLESERVQKPSTRGSHGLNVLVCPKCRGESYYDLREQVAWCWASGLIEIGDVLPADGPGGGAIEIARGPKHALKPQLQIVARHGMGASEGLLLVPGVPEAETQEAKGDALSAWLAWCNKRPLRDGVTYAKEFA